MFKRLLFLLFLPLFFSCTKKEPPSEGKLSVLVTIAPYAYFVERIAGETIAVQTLIPPSMNIHTYEPTPKLVEMSTQAKVWFRIDEPFEKKIVQALLEKNPQQKIVNLQEGLPLLSSEDAVELGSCEAYAHGGEDLHTWLSPKLALRQAKVISETLIALFPENKELYQKNFNDLALDMKKLDRNLDTLVTPYKGDALLVSHPALGYFCHDYGLFQLSVECEGKEPRPKDVERILMQAKKYTVRCVFLQRGFNNRGAILIGKKLQLPIYQIDPYAKDYLKNMREIAKYISS